MKVTLAQIFVSNDIDENYKKVKEILLRAPINTWVVFPEGILSGYDPENENYIKDIDLNKIKSEIDEIKKIIKEKKLHCIFGTAYKFDNRWFNTAMYIDKDSKEFLYKKVNLSNLDRKCFVAGDDLEVCKIDNDITFGIQICRDNAFPEQWKVLKRKGAKVVFHINNAINKNDIIRKNLLISRAFENQYYVISVNNSSAPQTLPSYVISPFGDILYESKTRSEEIYTIDIDINNVGDQYLSQERRDVVDLKYK